DREEVAQQHRDEEVGRHDADEERSDQLDAIGEAIHGAALARRLDIHRGIDLASRHRGFSSDLEGKRKRQHGWKRVLRSFPRKRESSSWPWAPLSRGRAERANAGLAPSIRRTVLREARLQLLHDGSRVAARLLHALGPGLL